MRFSRQVRAGFSITFGPAFFAATGLIGLLVTWMLRNKGVLNGSESVLVLPVAEICRCVLLHMSTMAGAFIALTAAAFFVENTRTTNQRDLFCELEIRPATRWLVQWVSVMTGMLLAAIFTVLLACAAILAEGLLRGQVLIVDFGGWSPFLKTLVYALPVLALFSSGAVLVSRLVHSGPVPIIGIGTVTIFNLLIIQHLMPSSLHQSIPTAWIGQWMRLTTNDHAVAFFWTIGTFPGGRGISGWLILTALALTTTIGIKLTNQKPIPAPAT